MKVLLVGGGGRAHALAWAISASPLLTKLYCAPGNAGIGDVAECVAIEATDFARLTAFAKEEKIDFAVISDDAQYIAGCGMHSRPPASAPRAQARRLRSSKARRAS